MTQLVDDDVLHEAWGQQEKGCVDHNNASGTAAAPLCGSELETDAADAYAERSAVDIFDEFRDTLALRVGKGLPKKSMECIAMSLRTDSYFPYILAKHCTSSASGREGVTICLSRCKTDGAGVFPLQDSAEGIHQNFCTLFQNNLRHAAEEIADVHLLFCLGEIARKADDYGIAFQHRSRVLVFRSYDAVGRGVGCHRVGSILPCASSCSRAGVKIFSLQIGLPIVKSTKNFSGTKKSKHTNSLPLATFAASVFAILAPVVPRVSLLTVFRSASVHPGTVRGRYGFLCDDWH